MAAELDIQVTEAKALEPKAFLPKCGEGGVYSNPTLREGNCGYPLPM